MAILQPLTTGQLLDRIFTLYRRNFLLFFGIALVPQAFYFLILLLPVLGISLVPKAAVGGIIATIIAALIGFVIYICALAVSQGATTVAVSGIYLEEPVSLVQSYRRMIPMALRLAGLMIGYGLLVIVGLVLLIVPGVYFLITYALSTAIMAIEKVSFSEAMSRSKDLIAGNRGRIAVIILLSFAITYAVTFGLAFPVQIAAAALAPKLPILSVILTFSSQLIAGALAAPIGLIGFTLAYYDARVRKEAFDLQHMIDSEAAVAASAAAAAGGAQAGA